MHDLIVVGAGIVGLAHALAAARRGLRVLVLDRDAQANGASVRNFGFVTVTGQARGTVWELARRSAEIWREIAAPAGIAIEQQGLLLVGQRPEAAAVIEAFAATEMGAGCTLLRAAEVAARFPMIVGPVAAGLHSSLDLRVESRDAIPRLARWLAEAYGVTFRYGAQVQAVGQGFVETADGYHAAEAIVLCPGDRARDFYPERIDAQAITRCKLQMLRLASPGWRLPAPVMADLSMVRYLGYAALPEAAALRTRLAAEEGEALAHGIHLIAVQGADGSLVVGDSHVYAPTPDPFGSEAIDDAILAQFARVLGPPPRVIERWTGTYASGPAHSIVERPEPGVRLVVVTSGTGASTAFALAEDVIQDLMG